jgi:4-diphosphocytidyl-2-C-methyl-D-erythritol kinase
VTGASVTLSARAKLTLSLLVTGTRPDGYHLLDAEMVTLDLADTLVVSDGAGLTVGTDWPGPVDGWRDPAVSADTGNLVLRALGAVGRNAAVHLVKRIPPGAGLGGGSADAAAVLRWAGCTDTDVAALIGADVPFCLTGGRARVTGIGEQLERLPFAHRSFVLLLAPFGVDTAAVYRAWDELHAGHRLPGPGSVSNDLEAAALVVEPRLEGWRRVLEGATGRAAQLAGSGSTWFVEGTPEELGTAGLAHLEHEGERSLLVAARTARPEA